MKKNKLSVEIGNISFSKEGYKNFVSLTEEQQMAQVMDSLSPRDPEQAKKLLKNVPNASNISQGSDKQASKDNRAGSSGRNGGDNPDGQKDTAGKKG